MDSQIYECMDIPEIDTDLLMELLEDAKEDETLAFAVSSLEEENTCADQLPNFNNAGALLSPDLIHAHEDCEDCSLDDSLSSLDGHECSVSSAYFADDLLDWVEIDIGMDSPNSEMDHQWQLDQVRGCNSFCYGIGEYVEQGFCPLWE